LNTTGPPMNSLKDLLANNRRWAANVTAQEPDFFE
jgi:carbonic anhydrase